GISACLLGDEVRYNAGHKRSGLCLDKLGPLLSYQKFCPEMAAGFGTPRPTLRLYGDVDSPQLVYNPGQNKNLDFNHDHAQQLRQGFEPLVGATAALDGYVLMSNSPSCGMERVKVYHRAASGFEGWHMGRGLFAAALMKAQPLLPVEEEGRLNDPQLIDSFVSRVFAHWDFRQRVLGKGSFTELLNFHSRYKYLLMAHSVPAYQEAGRLLATRCKEDFERQCQDYFTVLMAGLKQVATRKSHSNALLHVLGYLRDQLPGPARQDLADHIHRYRRGEIFLATPMALLKHYLQQYGSDYICQQVYLEPYPDSLGLRNAI
ncbi:MAG: DUF523 and DUF1722 domain-containing protein, partial [Cellvibrionaceae bacterium]|nr:DUF523 and DUF1722 domain-containing protein [Cellvibrionaceae bacterium]